ncbi:hypothetical protein POM88_024467 [Heracleum sosnowskyi]|uniref:Uncharacterized protein n=1 Tax=Heracleum sosnowskyi TaxID=360622 RepID=A0AAD8I2X5_9APIA|nr:hypothetical protein POM88_024467 [Heracleum sosnowskyi]
MDNTSLLNEIMRSNAIYNLSAADDEQEYYHELGTDESEDNEINNEEQDDSDHSTDNDEEQGEHISAAPWFATEDINVSLGKGKQHPVTVLLFLDQSADITNGALPHSIGHSCSPNG